MKTWYKMPTWWIRGNEQRGLRDLRGDASNLGPSTAGLLVYLAFVIIAGKADSRDGTISPTYTELEILTGISRHLISKGLQALEGLRLIGVDRSRRRNVYTLVGYDPDQEMPWGGKPSWGKIPRYRLLKDESTLIFGTFKLRHRAELDALKLYFAIVAFQQKGTNYSLISYPNLEKHTGVRATNIRVGLTHLVNFDVIEINRDSTPANDKNPPSQYRVLGVDPYRHNATTWRKEGGEGADVGAGTDGG